MNRYKLKKLDDYNILKIPNKIDYYKILKKNTHVGSFH